MNGKKCFYCGKYGLYRLHDKRLKCRHCKSYYSLHKLRRDLDILYYFYIEVSARKASKELRISYKSDSSRYMWFRKMIAEHLGEQFTKFRGGLELDETYFGGRGMASEEEGRITRQSFSAYWSAMVRYIQGSYAKERSTSIMAST